VSKLIATRFDLTGLLMGLAVLLALSVAFPFYYEAVRELGGISVPTGGKPLQITYGEMIFLLAMVFAWSFTRNFRPVRALAGGLHAPLRVRLPVVFASYLVILTGLVLPHMLRGDFVASDLLTVGAQSFLVFLVILAVWLVIRPPLKRGRIDG
jgi:hypothetical protein